MIRCRCRPTAAASGKMLILAWISFIQSLAFAVAASAQPVDQEASRKEVATIYVNCLDHEGSRILSKAPDTKPREFEHIATTMCTKIEEGFRKMLQIDIMIAQLNGKRFLNADERKVYADTIEQVIRNLRRTMVITYAQKYDAMHPGRRGCTVNNTAALDDPKSYLCAIRD
jgi:hypothetical protein